MDVYKQAELKPDSASKSRILSLLRAFPRGDPTRKRFVGEAVGYVKLAFRLLAEECH